MLKETVPTDHGVKTTKETLLKAVETRFGDVEQKPIYYLSTILDPRYKDLFFTRAAKLKARETLRDELEKMDTPRLASGPGRNDEREPPPAKRTRHDGNNNSLLGMFKAIIAENSQPAEQPENTRVDADVSVFLFNVMLYEYSEYQRVCLK